MVIQQRKILQSRTSVTLVGVPVGLNLFTMTPSTSYLEGDNGQVNLKSIVEIIFSVTAILDGIVIDYPVHKVVQEESGQWKFIGTK